MSNDDDNGQNDDADKHVTLWSIISSTALAALGVQTRANQERDFAGGNPLAFIIAGVVFTALFVLTLIGVVVLVLS